MHSVAKVDRKGKMDSKDGFSFLQQNGHTTFMLSFRLRLFVRPFAICKRQYGRDMDSDEKALVAYSKQNCQHVNNDHK